MASVGLADGIVADGIVADRTVANRTVTNGTVADLLEPDTEPGWDASVQRALRILGPVLAEVDPARLTGGSALALYSSLVAVERLASAGKTLLAPRIEASGVWATSGHRSAASLLAEVEGVPAGQAKGTLEIGHHLEQLPATEEAVRRGDLSTAKVAEIAGAGILDPAKESDLLEGAASEPLFTVRDRCRRSRATSATHDPAAALKRIRSSRHFSSWTDEEGGFCYRGRDTLDRGAKILEQIEWAASQLRRKSKTTDAPSEPEAANRADAFFLLLTRTPEATSTETPTGEADSDAVETPSPDAHTLIDRPPSCSVVVRVDLDVLFGREVPEGRTCEIDSLGPISPAMARDLANDSFLRLCFHRAGDIRSIHHMGRTIHQKLRTALVYRDTTCVVPGCGVSYGLEIDHVVPFAEGGPTELDNLALLCHHHHFLKTHEGWTLDRTGTTARGTPAWSFTPEAPFGQEPELGIDTPEARTPWHRLQE